MTSDTTGRTTGADDGGAGSGDAGGAVADAVGEPAAFRVQDLGRTGVLAVLWTVTPALSTIFLVAYLGDVSTWFASFGTAAPWLFAAAFAVVAGLGLAPTYSLSFLAGWTFGFWFGSASALVALLGAALVGFAIAHRVSAAHARGLIARFPKAEAVRLSLVDRGALRGGAVVALLRVPPNSPFSLTNLVLGTSGIRTAPYTIGTLLGLAPRTAVYVGMGAAGAASGAKDLGEALAEGPGWPVIVAGVVLVIVVLDQIGRMARRALEQITAEDLERARAASLAAAKGAVPVPSASEDGGA